MIDLDDFRKILEFNENDDEEQEVDMAADYHEMANAEEQKHDDDSSDYDD